MGIYIYSSDQIEKIRKACKIVADVLDRLKDIVEEGISTFELDSIAQNIIEESGGKPAFLGYRGYPAALCTSINEVVVHGIPDKKTKLKKGDVIGVDVGVFLDGYYGDAAFTYTVGQISEDAHRLLEVTRESLNEGIKVCNVGNRISDISHAIEKIGRASCRERV